MVMNMKTQKRYTEVQHLDSPGPREDTSKIDFARMRVNDFAPSLGIRLTHPDRWHHTRITIRAEELLALRAAIEAVLAEEDA
jgi:hypothetical protein